MKHIQFEQFSIYNKRNYGNSIDKIIDKSIKQFNNPDFKFEFTERFKNSFFWEIVVFNVNKSRLPYEININICDYIREMYLKK